MALHHKYRNPTYIHHAEHKNIRNIREIVFGIQDGMVSTLGAVTGIAIGSGELFVVLLSGVSIIAVESISMGIGSYVGSRSEKKLGERMLSEERQEIKDFPAYEKEELKKFFIDDGWSPELAEKMVEEASHKKKLMLREMAYRELHILPDSTGRPVMNGLIMFGAYIVGGLVPLSAYFFLPVTYAILISIVITLCGLFVLGSSIGVVTKEAWYKTGAHMFVFGGAALLVGYSVGLLFKFLLQ